MYVVAENVNPALYVLTSFRNIVTAGLLSSFSLSNSEILFFVHNNVTILCNGTIGISEAGYNSGNYLIGLQFSSDLFLLEY